MKSQFAPAMTVLFVLVKLAFVTLLSGTVWVDSSKPVLIFEAVNE